MLQYNIIRMTSLEQNNQNTILNHNPNSFFYKSAQAYQDMSNNSIDIENNCSDIGDTTWDNNTVWNDKCNDKNFPGNSSDCLKVANCKNYYETKELYGNKNNYSASGQLYLDNRQDYKKSMIDSINFTVSSAFLVYVIIKKAFE